MNDIEVSIKNISINGENVDWWLTELVSSQFKDFFDDWKKRNGNNVIEVDSILESFRAGFFTGLSYGLEAQKTPEGMMLID